MSPEFIINALILFIAGVLVASAFYTIAYIAGRKSTSDELDERGITGRKRG